MIDSQNKTVLHVLFTGLVTRGMVSGGDQLFLDIAPRLPKSIKIVIITPLFAKELWEGVDQSNIEFRFLKGNIFDHKDNPLMIFLSYFVRSHQVYRILKKEKVQLLYSCSDVAYADIWPAFFLKKTGIRWITRIYHVLLPPQKRQGNFFTNILAFYLQKISFWMMKRKSTRILALNQKLYDEVSLLGFPKSKLGILGAGIDFNYIHNFKPTKKYDFDAVVLGRIAPVKGIFDMLKIWAKVNAHNPEWKLAWIGGGAESMQSKVKMMIRESNLEKSFNLLGFIDKTEVYNLLKSAKVFLCPDHENGWGLAVCEAMSASLPVVSYNIDIFGGLYKKGFVSAPLFNTNAFADELIKVLESKSLREKLAKEATLQASEFDHEKVIKDFTKILASKT